MARQMSITVGDYTEDADRISDEIWSDAQGKIVDRDTFDIHFEDFIKFRDNKISQKQRTKLAPVVFEQMQRKHPEVSHKREFQEFSKAGGKNFKRDRERTHKVIVTNTRDYRKKTAQKSDLRGVDTKPLKPRYVYVGRVRGKVVKARKTFVIKRGKSVPIYRDRKGRFVSRKK